MRTQLAYLAFLLWAAASAQATEFRGEIVDADTGKPIPARLYAQAVRGGKWYFARSAAAKGSAVEYRKQRGNDGRSIEMHTTLSAHPFVLDLPAGKYRVTIERGKEYHTLAETITVAGEPISRTFRLRRWINMAQRGWYSGDTHTHRTLAELPNVALAEDLNVSLPLTYWVTRGYKSPATSEKNTTDGGSGKLIKLDDTHVIYPRNTEYEIFTIDGKRHTLGAVFVLNHQSVFKLGAPPVIPIAKQAKAEGALLELDKHNWPWSMAIVPTMNVDLFELTNNHIWRTGFYFRKFGEAPPAYMKIATDANGMTENGWIEFGFQNYYALLNCGFRLRPTAGTASGVHPVPLGFGRVYVHLSRGFNYKSWIKGLDAGNSFVTTGPMLFATFDGKPPGHTFSRKEGGSCRVTGSVISSRPVDRIEIVAAGEVVRQITPKKVLPNKSGTYEVKFDETIKTPGSTWVCVRCYETQPDGRTRFAHTAPVHIDVAGTPLRPRKVEIAYLIRRVKAQILRSRNVLPKAAIKEYEQALEVYERIARSAR